jgi:predicted ATPase
MINRESKFVDREIEFEWLQQQLKETLDGKGRVVLISGEPGAGKTSLIREFSLLADKQIPDLIVVDSECDALTGNSTAYAPFKQLMEHIYGDLSDPKKASKSKEKLRKTAVSSIELLMEFAPDLIGTIIPGASLLAKIGTATIGKLGWTEKIKSKIKGKEAVDETELRGAGGVEQEKIYDEYTKLLRKLSEKHPLMLVLEDLQWIDNSSLDLLFHIFRKCQDSKIIIIGTYRPSDLDLENKQSHILKTFISEHAQHSNNCQLSLDAPNEEHSSEQTAKQKYFLQAYIRGNYYPNDFPSDFEDLIVKRTQGNPLFISELLRDLEEKNVLMLNNDGAWHLNQSIKTDDLPEKVGSVIESRISRISDELKDVLRCGSIEGEEFSAEVLAMVRKVDEFKLLEELDVELRKRYRLISDDGVLFVNNKSISRFQFSHSLFHTHVYKEIGEARRVKLHLAVAVCLEELYQGEIGSIAPQLARHYEVAHQWQNAAKYSAIAARNDFLQYAYDSAITFSKKGLEFIERLPKKPDTVTLKSELLDLLGDCYSAKAEYSVAQKYYEDALPLITKPVDRATIFRQLGDLFSYQAFYEKAMEYYNLADKELKQVDSKGKEWALLQVSIAYIHNCQFEKEAGIQTALKALPVFEQLDDTRGIIRANNIISSWRNSTESEHYSKRSIELAESIGDILVAAKLQTGLSITLRNSGKLKEGEELLKTSIEVLEKFEQYKDLSFYYSFRGMIEADLGLLNLAEINCRKGIDLSIKIGNHNSQEKGTAWLGIVKLWQGDLEEAYKLMKEGLEMAGAVHYSHTFEHTWALVYLCILMGKISESDALLSRLDNETKFLEERPVDHIQYLLSKGLQALNQNAYANATTHFENSIKIAEQNGFAIKHLIEGYLYTSIALFESGDIKNATKHANLSKELAETHGYRPLLALAHREISKCMLAKGNKEDAESNFYTSIDLLENLGANYELGRTLFQFSSALVSNDDVNNNDVLAFLKRALVIFETCGASKDKIETQKLIDKLYTAK